MKPRHWTDDDVEAYEDSLDRVWQEAKREPRGEYCDPEREQRLRIETGLRCSTYPCP